jgi:hypothetical protein
MTFSPEVDFLVRNFANHSFRYLFSERENAANFIRWVQPTLAEHIDFSQIALQPVTFITPTFHQLECDVLLRAPWRGDSPDAGGIEVFILIEHQSEPDIHMTFRLWRYVMLVYDRQEREWLKTHKNTRDLLYHPVLPIVFYSGPRGWGQLRPMRELVYHGDLFGPLIPQMEAVFVNLTETEPEVLRNQVGIFGWVLWLIQQKRQKLEEFEVVLRQVVTALDGLPTESRGLRIHLLWFLRGLVYHSREKPEWGRLSEIIVSSVREEYRSEVELMGQTIAEALLEEGELKGEIKGAIKSKRATLLRLIQLRFSGVSPAILAEIEATKDNQKLDEWLDAFATAKEISEMPFQANKN